VIATSRHFPNKRAHPVWDKIDWRHDNNQEAMMTGVVTRAEDITPEWLTTHLRKAGTLDHGEVISVEKNISQPFGSIVARLTISYSANAPETAPQRLFLKYANADSHREHPERGRNEIHFYRFAGNSPDLPIPRCYDATYSDEGFHLLLDDLAHTHFQIAHPLPPHQPQCEQLVDALARLHAHWWDDPRLGVEIAVPLSDKSLFMGGETIFPEFADMLGDRLWDERRQIFERVIAAAPKLVKQFTNQKDVTLIHGDAHAWNFLYPHDADKHLAMLVDWEAYGVDVGPFDLAYMIGLFWFPAHRARAEYGLVRRYHRRLLEHGVIGYGWADCWHDYRFSVIRTLFMPVLWWNMSRDSDFWPELWWPRLERVLCAFEDLHCDELL
jgi:thiamine kinase-like enzyme